MKAWDVFDYEFPSGKHPAAVVSNDRRVAKKPDVVILACRTMRADTYRDPEETEALLDETDGLDWKTLCKCDLLFTVQKALLTHHRGSVAPARRGEISRKIIQGLALAGH